MILTSALLREITIRDGNMSTMIEALQRKASKEVRTKTPMHSNIVAISMPLYNLSAAVQTLESQQYQFMSHLSQS